VFTTPLGRHLLEHQIGSDPCQSSSDHGIPLNILQSMDRMISTAPVIIICTPMQRSRNADNRVMTLVPSLPKRRAIELVCMIDCRAHRQGYDEPHDR
jgi:hypothetical protein